MLKLNKKSLSKLGSLNPQWKGDNVGYGKLHEWVKNRLLKPEICPKCKTRKAYDLANKGIYNRDLNNWEWLCRYCHMKSDGRLETFFSYKKSFEKGNQYYKNRIDLKGDSHPLHKLSSNDVIKIRNYYKTGNYTQQQLAEIFNVCFQSISCIILRKTWKHL